MADPTNTITVINKDTGATIGSYSTMTEALAVTTAGGNFEWVFDGEIAQGTGTQFRTAAKDLVISGSGKVTTNVTFWVGNASSNSTNLTVSDGAVAHFAVGEGGLNFRYENWTNKIDEETSVTVKKASTLTIDNGRLYVTSREMPTNGLITVYGYGAEAQKDSSGNVLYGMKQANGDFLANLDVKDNAITVKDRFNEYKDNDNIAFVLKDYAWTNASTINLSTDDTGNKSVAIVENSKITLGGSENKGQLNFSVAGAEMRISGDSEFYGGLKFNKTGSFSLKDESTAVLSSIDGAQSAKIKYTNLSNSTEGETTFTLVGSGTIDVDGLQASVAIDKIGNNGDITFTLTSDDFSSIAESGQKHTMLEFVNSHLYETCTVVGKTVEIENALIPVVSVETKDHKEFSALEYVKVTIDGNAYTIGDTFAIDGQDYKISWEALGDDGVANDLVAKNITVDPYMISSQNFVTDTTLSGTAKAYYRNPDESYSGFKSIYNVGSGATLTIAEGVAVDLERDASGTKSIILVGANNYFASQGFEATGAGNLVVNGTLDVGQLNAMADGTITVNGELNITTACIEKGALIYNSGSIGAINALNIFNDANATVTVNGLATLTLAGEPAHAFNEKGATDIASRFVVNVTDADLADMTGDTHTILDVKSSSVSIADKFTLNVNGAAYTMGEEFSDAAGNKYVINMGDAGGDSTANDLIVTLTEKAPEPVIPEDPVLPEDPGAAGGVSTDPSQKVYINPYYNEHTLGYFSDVVGEELVLGKNAFTSVAAAKKALGANADIEYCTSDWNNSFSNSKQLEGIAKISNNGYSMGYSYANYVQQYNMSNGALNLNKVTADTDFENFAYVNISGSKLSGAIENNAFGFFGTGNAEKASGTAWFAQGGMVNISGSTVGEVTGYAYATLNGSDVDVLSNNDVLYANVTLENGEITSCKPIYAMANGMAQINNSDVGLLENYSYVNMSGSNIADVRNVNMIGNWGGSSSIDNFVGASMYSSISNGYGCSLTLGDVTMNGSFDSIVNYGGTLVLTGNLKGVEMLYGYGDLVASDEQIKQLGGAEKVKQTYFGDIVDLGSTADGFSGKAAELADNTEAKAVIWDAAAEGGLRGWLGIGSDVDVKDSVDYVKFTAASDGTLDITSSAWSSTGDKVSINGTDLAITDGAVSFGVTAGTEYLVKIERKDNNSMSYDMTLA